MWSENKSRRVHGPWSTVSEGTNGQILRTSHQRLLDHLRIHYGATFKEAADKLGSPELVLHVSHRLPVQNKGLWTRIGPPANSISTT